MTEEDVKRILQRERVSPTLALLCGIYIAVVIVPPLVRWLAK